MILWRQRRVSDAEVKSVAELQERTDEIVEQFREEAKRARIITTKIKTRIDFLEAHRGT